MYMVTKSHTLYNILVESIQQYWSSILTNVYRTLTLHSAKFHNNK